MKKVFIKVRYILFLSRGSFHFYRIFRVKIAFAIFTIFYKKNKGKFFEKLFHALAVSVQELLCHEFVYVQHYITFHVTTVCILTNLPLQIKYQKNGRFKLKTDVV